MTDMTSAESGSGYFNRILLRRLKWWGMPHRPTDWRYYPWRIHRLREHVLLRHRNDPEERWRCCEHWQRTLISKWNSREYVQRFDIPVPELYWIGRRAHHLPIERLPERFVIRPNWGAAKRGVHVIVDGQKLMGKGSPHGKSLLRQIVKEHGRINVVPLLCEEAIVPKLGKPRLPLEYKCHMFAGVVGAIQIIDRSNGEGGRSVRHYDQDWTPFEQRMCNARVSQLPIQEPPPFLESLLNWSRQLGSAIGTYMRVDFFGADDRCVFNEFSSTPGTSDKTPFQDELFESLWQTQIPDHT